MNKWWGYLHTNGTIQVKRFFDAQDIVEAIESPFATEIYYPFDAKNREDAIQEIKKRYRR